MEEQPIKISELEETLESFNEDFFPIVQNNETKRIRKSTFLYALKDAIDIKTNAITGILTSNINVTSSSNYENIDVPVTAYNLSGDALFINNGKIVIGTGIHKVLINAQMGTQGNSDAWGIAIYRNNTHVFGAFDHINTPSFCTMSTGPYLLDVESADEISLKIYIDSAGTTKTVRRNETFITIQAIS
jgi:hypothetical protein